jgi:UDP-2,4-diacetamido-2,4,6-trideoxy-beta-L-altropyranose hydrolase
VTQSENSSAGGVLFLFRANSRVGLGHYMRSRRLAEILRQCSIRTVGLTGNSDVELPGLASCFDELVRFSGEMVSTQDVLHLIDVHTIQHVVVDDYELDASLALGLNSVGVKWLQQFDASRPVPFWAPIVVNSSPSIDYHAEQFPRMNAQSVFLFGPEYAVLRREFSILRSKHREQRGGTAIVCLGGGNDSGVGARVAERLQQLGNRVTLVTGLGSHRPVPPSGERRIRHITFSDQISDELHAAEFAVVSGGTLSYEAACLGLPFVTVAMAQNQVRSCLGWQQTVGVPYLGLGNCCDDWIAAPMLVEFATNVQSRQELAQRARARVDGRGAARLLRTLVGGQEQMFDQF